MSLRHGPSPPTEAPLGTGAERPQPYFDIHHQAEHLLLAKYVPPDVVINHDIEILHSFGETGPYLNPTPGSASRNLLKMARQDLAAEMRAFVHNAGKEDKPLRRNGVRMRLPGGEKTTIDQQAINRGETMQFEESSTLADGVHIYLSVKFPIRSADSAIFGTGGVTPTSPSKIKRSSSCSGWQPWCAMPTTPSRRRGSNDQSGIFGRSPLPQ